MGLFDDLPPEGDVPIEKNPFKDLPPETDEPAPSAAKTKSEETLQGLARFRRGDPREGITSTVGNIATQVAAGLAGVGQAAVEFAKTTVSPKVGGMTPDFDAPAARVRQVQEKGRDFFAPRTPAGQATAEGIGKGVEGVATAVKYPLSAIPFVIGGSEERQEFMEVPIGDYLGQLAQDNGASPLWATMAHIAPDVALTATAIGTSGKAKAALTKPAKVKPPTIRELKTQSRALYDIVDNAGMTLADDSVKAAYNSIVKMAESKGLRAKLTPKSFSALDEMAKDIRAGGLTLKKAEELRRVIKQAQATMDKADAAMAGRILGKWDDFIENLKPADITGGAGVETVQYLKSARNLWSRARKTEVVEDLIERAHIRAGQFTGSGFQNALVTEFRQLVLNHKRIRLFTKAEQKALRLVANGTPLDKAFRQVGKLAPTGVVSLGVGTGLGYASGIPGGAFILPAVGMLSRKISESRTLKKAEQASELMRRGPS